MVQLFDKWVFDADVQGRSLVINPFFLCLINFASALASNRFFFLTARSALLLLRIRARIQGSLVTTTASGLFSPNSMSPSGSWSGSVSSSDRCSLSDSDEDEDTNDLSDSDSSSEEDEEEEEDSLELCSLSDIVV